MKTKLLAFSIFAATAVTVTFLPTLQHALATTTTPVITPVTVDPIKVLPANNEQPKIEVVFVLDTTGSMSGLIDTAKEKYGLLPAPWLLLKLHPISKWD